MSKAKPRMHAQDLRLAEPRLRWRRRAVHTAFSALARIGNYAGDVRAARESVEVIRDVAYGEHPVAHRLDVYRPRYAARPLPVLMYIHGGAFVLCSKETHASIALLHAQQTDYLVFNINYRLAPNHPFPAAIEDVCAAYRWIVANAEAYGGDPMRIVVAGESAGGNLALGVAIAASYRRPEPYAAAVHDTGVPPLAVMPLMPYLQVSDPLRHHGQQRAGYFGLSVARDIARAYLGRRIAASEATYMADPIRVLEECGAPARDFPAVFTGVGTADLCCTDVRRLELACRSLQIPVAAYYYADEVHAFHALRWRAVAQQFVGECVSFLRRVAEPQRVLPPRPRPLHGLTARAAATLRQHFLPRMGRPAERKLRA